LEGQRKLRVFLEYFEKNFGETNFLSGMGKRTSTKVGFVNNVSFRNDTFGNVEFIGFLLDGSVNTRGIKINGRLHAIGCGDTGRVSRRATRTGGSRVARFKGRTPESISGGVDVTVVGSIELGVASPERRGEEARSESPIILKNGGKATFEGTDPRCARGKKVLGKHGSKGIGKRNEKEAARNNMMADGNSAIKCPKIGSVTTSMKRTSVRSVASAGGHLVSIVARAAAAMGTSRGAEATMTPSETRRKRRVGGSRGGRRSKGSVNG